MAQLSQTVRATKEAFAQVGVVLPVVSVQYRHASPTAAEQSEYFGALAKVLNEATPASPLAIVFDASALTFEHALSVSLSFISEHNKFNSLFKARFETCCIGFGLVLPPLPALASIIQTVLKVSPSSRPITPFTTLEAAQKALRVDCAKVTEANTGTTKVV